MFRRLRELWALPAEFRVLRAKVTETLHRVTELYAQETAYLHRCAKERNEYRAQAEELRSTVRQLEPLQAAMEMAGNRRVFGGSIDVDYDKLANALGPEGEAELLKTLKDRARKPVAKRTPAKAKPRANGTRP